MKNISFLLYSILFCSSVAFPQITHPIRVKAGEDLLEKLAREIYLYPHFQNGTIVFRDGRKNSANFNYNMLNGEIQFVSPKGDTLSLTNELTIKNINIAADSFFYSEGYLQLIAGNATVKLLRKQNIKIIDQQKIGAYDQPSAAASITSYTSFSNDLRTFKLDVRQDLVLARITNYYIGDEFNHFSRINKKNLLKIFPKKEKEISNYLKENNIDFNNEADLINLITFLKEY